MSAFTKKSLSLLLSLCVLFSLVSSIELTAQAATADEITQAVTQLREGIKRCQEEIRIVVSECNGDEVWNIYLEALKHTGVPDEGDYFEYNFYPYSYTYFKNSDNTTTIKYEIRYYTTYEREMAVNEEIARIKNELDIDGESDYKKLCSIYDYLCTTVDYDYQYYYKGSLAGHPESCYSALIDKKAICSGFAKTLYRLCLEYGIDARYIAGKTDDGAGHAWNIVKIDGKYYYCDSTWDEKRAKYNCFLKGANNFNKDHIPDEEYRESIVNCYNISNTDYTPGYTGIQSSFDESKAYTSGAFRYVLNPDGVAKLVSYTGSEANVVIPSKIDNHKVYIVDGNAFLNNKYVERVEISEGIKLVSAQGPSFRGCKNLKTIVLPSTVTAISYRNHVFDCDNFAQYIVSPENTRYSAENGVLLSKDKTELISYPMGNTAKKYEVPSAVTYMSSFSFAYNPFVEEVVLPEGIITISDEAFFYCTSLKKINIPESCAYIRGDAFAFSVIEELYLPENFKSLDDVALRGMLQLKRITVNKGNNKYYDVDGVLFERKSGTNEKCLFFYPANHGESYTVPDDVKYINSNAFAYSKVKEVIIPQGVVSIGEDAFSNSEIESIVLPNGLKRIESYTFDRCEALKDVVIPDSVTEIGDFAFYVNRSLRSVKLPSNLSTIGYAAFGQCSSLESIEFPRSVTKIDDFAFYNCLSLRWAEIPETINNISDYAFKFDTVIIKGIKGSYAEEYANANGFTFWDINKNAVSGEDENIIWTLTPDGNLSITGSGELSSNEQWQPYASVITSVSFGEGVEKINADFSNTDIQSVTLPASLKEIGDYCFENTKITSVTIPENVQTIGTGAFGNCQNLENITVNDNNKNYVSVNGVLFSKDKTALIQYPIARSDTQYTIPDGVVEIKEGAFKNCKALKQISIPVSVQCIYGRAFYGCDSLTDIYFAGSEAEWNRINVLGYNPSLEDATVHFAKDVCTTHIYDAGTVNVWASCYSEGLITYTCLHCGHTMTQSTEKLPHTFGDNGEMCLICGAYNPDYVAPTPSDPTTTDPKPAKPSTGEANTPVTEKPGNTNASTPATSTTASLSADSVSPAKVNVAKITLSSVKSKKSKQITVSWKKNTKVNGYEIQYTTDKRFKKSVKKVTVKKNKTTSTTIKKLSGKKKYYVRIRAYKTVNGKKHYSAWSKAKTVTTKK